MTPAFKQLPPLTLYIHIPWCIRKCPYCDFNSHAAKHDLAQQETAYVNCLLKDLDRDLAYVQDRPLQSIFFGGGTPSLFSPDAIARLLQQIQQRIDFDKPIEITLEANPGTFEQEKFAAFRSAGINRLSIGVQSFNDAHLQRLGRVHSGDEARHAVASAVDCGFDNFNLDLMHGLPQQHLHEALADLAIAEELTPQHLSWYQLTIEPNTQFYKTPPDLPDEETLWAIQQQGVEFLTQRGFRQYEISAWSKAGHESKHNLNYWRFGDYLGIGAGAHGKITQLAQQRIIRTRKTRLPEDYLAAIATSAAIETVPAQAIAGEFMMNALRLNQGFTAPLFEERCGLPIDAISKPIELARQRGLLHNNAHFRASNKGRQFLNDLVELFI